MASITIRKLSAEPDISFPLIAIRLGLPVADDGRFQLSAFIRVLMRMLSASYTICPSRISCP